jgi:hypothetical protein
MSPRRPGILYSASVGMMLSRLSCEPAVTWSGASPVSSASLNIVVSQSDHSCGACNCCAVLAWLVAASTWSFLR